MANLCKVGSCDRRVTAHGYCSRHSQQFRAHGRILARTSADPPDIRQYAEYAELVLYNKQSVEIRRVLIDLDDVERISQHKWASHGVTGYVHSRTGGFLHRFVMGNPEGLQIDHISNRADNRKKMLRVASQAENAWHKGMKTNNTSGFKGITLNKKVNKWGAHIGHNYQTVWLGLYSTKEEAAKAYDRAALQIFGEFALTNKKLGLVS